MLRILRWPVVAVIALMLALTGCGSNGAGGNKSNVATGQDGFADVAQVAAQLGTDAPDGVFPRTVRNIVANGKIGDTVIPAKPKRVIVLDTGELDNMLALGIQPVGVAHPDGTAMAPDYLKVTGATDLGSYDALDLEQIKNLHPDLILGTSLRIDDDSLKQKLQAIAPTVLAPRPGIIWKQNFLLNAAAVGEEGKAKALLAAYQTRVKKIGAEIVKANGGTAPTISMLRFMAGRTRLYGNGSFIGTILKDAGLPRPALESTDELAVEISPEEITEADGDWLLWGTYGDPSTTEQAAVVDGPLWKQVKAVADGGVVKQVNDETWYLGLGVLGANQVLDDLQSIADSLR